MAESKVPFHITYRKTGTSPPIYIAGSFSDPQWQLQEMDHGIDGDGEHTFKAQLMVEPEKEYQFKLRIGEGDWWILSDNYPIATDDSGNQNNLLIAPRPSADANARETDKDKGKSKGKGKGKSTDGLQRRQPNSSSKPDIVIATNDDDMGDADNLKTPLFAHECIGAYDFADISDHELDEREVPRRQSRPKSKDLEADVDVNDPTLEAFPSDRTSIMDAIRTIQTHLSEDQTHLNDIPLSPRVVSARRTSIDSVEETSLLSPAAPSPTTSRKRDSRLSHSSASRNRPAASLGSIAEEPKPASKGAQKPPRISPPDAKQKPTAADLKSPRSEEDEGVVMTTSEVTPNNQAHEISPAQISTSIEPTRDAPLDSEPVQEQESSLGAEGVSIVEPDHPTAGVASESTESLAPHTSYSKQESNSPISKTDPPSRSVSGRSPAKRPTADPSLVRSLFRALFGSKSNVILATGVAALAIGIGWWKMLDKQVIKSGLL